MLNWSKLVTSSSVSLFPIFIAWFCATGAFLLGELPASGLPDVLLPALWSLVRLCGKFGMSRQVYPSYRSPCDKMRHQPNTTTAMMSTHNIQVKPLYNSWSIASRPFLLRTILEKPGTKCALRNHGLPVNLK
ncbi:hypothetical protein H4582DRAFT_591307 [Lactarius indigo]|nr:hypothetical protein H4582DRAFT_591307 [Lactarius indigo]